MCGIIPTDGWLAAALSAATPASRGYDSAGRLVSPPVTSPGASRRNAELAREGSPRGGRGGSRRLPAAGTAAPIT